jgi:hypothetical protein
VGSSPTTLTLKELYMKHSPETVKESLRRCQVLRDNYWDILPEGLKVYVIIVEKDGKASKQQAKRAKSCGFNSIIKEQTTNYEAVVRAITACAARNNGVLNYVSYPTWETDTFQ